MTPQQQQPLPSFEEAYSRLEQILEKMNGGTLSLEESLKFYEEAGQLIQRCTTLLTDAEQRIEKLTKTQSGELLMSAQGMPTKEPF